MNISEAALLLHESLRHHSWYRSVGIGNVFDGELTHEYCLTIYIASDTTWETWYTNLGKLAKGWHNYPVQIRKEFFCDAPSLPF